MLVGVPGDLPPPGPRPLLMTSLPAYPRLLLLGLLALLASGCANYLTPFETQRARPAPPTPTADALSALPPPREPIVAAVYRFRDQTGQYKALENVSTFSTQVTQGATSILMRALEESRWFVPIEREGLSNLLNERQIIQSIRAQHAGPEGEPLGPLPPLLYAGVLLEGGIIGYDSNVLTGGVGVRYLGTGGAGEYRQDQVTVYLRAVSTQSGRVLKSVHTTKTIVSQRVQGNLFRFVDLQRLLEAEIGYSYNEPPVLAVTEAIEEAVRALIIEGLRENLWAAAENVDPAQLNALFAAYDRETAAAEQLDAFGRDLGFARTGTAVSVSGAGNRLESDYADALVRPAGELAVRAHVSPRLSLGLAASGGSYGIDGLFDQLFLAGEATARYDFLPQERLTPFLQVGLGVVGVPDGSATREIFPHVRGGGGLEYMLSRGVGLSLALTNLYPLSEGLDGVEGGGPHDNLFLLQAGLTFHGL